MSSQSVYIKDMLEALGDGRVPGEWNEDRSAFAFPTVTSTNVRGAKLFWEVTVRLLKGSKAVPIADEYLAQPVEQLPPGFRAEITVEAKQGEDGKVRDHVPTYVTSGKNLGKANATNAITQAFRDALSKYNKQLHRGDTVAAPGSEGPAAEDAEDAEASPEKVPARLKVPAAIAKEAADLHPPPMLVKKLGESREASLMKADFARGITVQPKLNGVRNVCFRTSAEAPAIYMYSRSKHEYKGMNGIREELLPMLDPKLLPAITAGTFGVPEKYIAAYAAGPVYLDGELFKLGKSLQWISGQARKESDEGLLDYNVFDCFFPAAKALGHDMESRHRQAYLDAIFAEAAKAGLASAGVAAYHVVRVPGRKAASEAEMMKLAREFVAAGYEGAIARKDWAGYRYSQNNYHSANLVKIKPLLSSEFRVVDFTQGDKGKDVGAIIWVCEVPEESRVIADDFTFNTVPKNMTYEQRYKLFTCMSAMVDDPTRAGEKITRFRRDIYGLPLTVDYPELSTKTGKPVQAKGAAIAGIAFRTYEDGGENDPVRKVFKDCGVVDD